MNIDEDEDVGPIGDAFRALLGLRAGMSQQKTGGSAYYRNKAKTLVFLPACAQALSRRAAGGRPSAAACAKRGSIGQMQISAELVPIPDASRMRPDTSGYVRIRPGASGF